MTDVPDLDQLPFDDAIEQLEALAGQLEDGDIPLEESLQVYERAVALFRHCRTRLGSVEQKLELLTRDLGDEPTVTPLEAGPDD